MNGLLAASAVLLPSLILSSESLAFSHLCLGSGETQYGYDMEHLVNATAVDAMSYTGAGFQETLYPGSLGSILYGPYTYLFSDSLFDGYGFNFAEGWIYATRMHGEAALMSGGNVVWVTHISCNAYWG